MKEKQLFMLRNQCIALQEAMNLSRRSRTDDTWLFSSYKTFMRKYNEIVKNTSQIIDISLLVDYYNLDKVPGPYDTVTIQQRVYFDEVYSNLSILKSIIDAHGEFSENDALSILNFIKANLRKTIHENPESEKTIQNSIESLLIGKGLQKGIDYDRETGRVKVAGKESIPDFIFIKEGLAFEVKLCNREGKLSKIVDEINSDIVSYSEKYRLIWFVIYDIGLIRDEDELIKGIEKKEGIKLIIVKH